MGSDSLAVPVDAAAQHLHIVGDAGTVALAVEFPEFCWVACAAVIGIPLAFQATVIALFASHCGFGPQHVVALHTLARGAHLHEVLSSSAALALHSSVLARSTFQGAFGTHDIDSVFIEPTHTGTLGNRTASGVLVLEALLTTGSIIAGFALEGAFQALSILRIVVFPAHAHPVGILVSMLDAHIANCA